MFIWDYRGNYKRRIAGLSRGQRLNVCAVWIEASLSMLGAGFWNALPAESRELLASGLDILWCAFERGTLPEPEQQQCLMARLDESMAFAAGDGEGDILAAMYYALQAVFDTLDDQHVFETAWYAYATVLTVEVLSTLEREMIEDEVRSLEANNDKCMACLAQQLEYLDRIGRGEVIPRIPLPS